MSRKTARQRLEKEKPQTPLFEGVAAKNEATRSSRGLCGPPEMGWLEFSRHSNYVPLRDWQDQTSGRVIVSKAHNQML